MPKSISTFSPGLNAGKPGRKRSEPFRLPSKFQMETRTEIGATRAPECIPQIAVPTTASGLRRQLRSRNQLLPVRQLHLRQAPSIRTVQQDNHVRVRGLTFLLLQLRKSASTALARFLSPRACSGRWLAGWDRLLTVSGSQ